MRDAKPQRATTNQGALLSKVPMVTVFFWVIKVLCTTVGETASDFLNVNLGLGLRGTSIAAGACLIVALFVQIRAKRYVPAIYWLAVVLISVFGTLITDILTDSLHLPLEISTILFTVALGLTFGAWYAKEGTLSIHSILTRRREVFYWLAILFTFALGTATGDLMAEKLGLGYLLTGLIVLAVIVCAGIAWRLGLDAVLAFWIAYILTRPLGASLGDYLSQAKADGGLGLGATITSVVFLGAILAVVIYLGLTRRDAIAEPEPNPSATSDAQEHKERAHTERGRGAVWQLVAVLVVLSSLALAGYYVRSSQIAKQAAASSSPDQPLGDLSSFRTITADMRALVRSGNTAGAKAKADDLETAWDRGQARMKPMNSAKWTTMDDAIDAVLKTTRASPPNAVASGAALDALLVVIDSLDKPK
jgi:uncharacterized membrane-anchored protein